MVQTQERLKPFSWEELMSILREKPPTPHESFSKAVRAVVRSYEEGYISYEEADILLRSALAHHISTTMEGWINSSIMDLLESAGGRSNRHSLPHDLSERWFSHEGSPYAS